MSTMKKVYKITKKIFEGEVRSTSCILKTDASYSEVASKFKYDDSIHNKVLYLVKELKHPNKSWKIWDEDKKFTSVEEAYEYLSNFEFVDRTYTIEKSLEYVDSFYNDIYDSVCVRPIHKVYEGNDITFFPRYEHCLLEEILKLHHLSPRVSVNGNIYVWNKIVIDRPGVRIGSLEVIDIYKTVEHVKVTEIRYK